MKHLIQPREMTTLIKCGTLLIVLFYGEPSLMGAVIDYLLT